MNGRASDENIESKMACLSLTAPESLGELRLPSRKDFIGSLNPTLANAIVAQALPEDQERFRNYLQNVFCGIGIITAVSYPDLRSDFLSDS
jgi:hypothetical protein